MPQPVHHFDFNRGCSNISNLSFGDNVKQISPCELTNDVCPVLIVNLCSTTHHTIHHVDVYSSVQFSSVAEFVSRSTTINYDACAYA